MTGLKLDQTKETMVAILDSLNDHDFFNIVTFNTNVVDWVCVSCSGNNNNYTATLERKRGAVKHVKSLTGSGYSDLNGAILKALDISKRVKSQMALPVNAKQFIFLMTDGHANTEGGAPSSQESILSNIASSGVPML
jgi:hypothetical protein